MRRTDSGTILQAAQQPQPFNPIQKRYFGDKKQWTAEDDTLLLGDTNNADVAAALGRSEKAVEVRRSRLATRQRTERAPETKKKRRAWSKKDVRELRALIREGLDDSAIAAAIGRTMLAAKSKRVELGLYMRGPYRMRRKARTSPGSATIRRAAPRNNLRRALFVAIPLAAAAAAIAVGLSVVLP